MEKAIIHGLVRSSRDCRETLAAHWALYGESPGHADGLCPALRPPMWMEMRRWSQQECHQVDSLAQFSAGHLML